MDVALIPPRAGEVFVAKQCAHCGKMLSSDTMRYCTGCGNTVGSSRPVKRSLTEEPPAWMKQLESSFTNSRSDGKLQSDLSNISTNSLKSIQASSLKSEEANPQPAPDNPDLVSPQDISLPIEMNKANVPEEIPDPKAPQSAKPLTNIPLRELRVKVWEQEETKVLSLPVNNDDSLDDEVDVVDDMPTIPLAVTSSPKISTQLLATSNHTGIDIDEEEVADEFPTNPLIASLSQNPPNSHVSPSSATGIDNGTTRHDEIEDIATRPHAAQPYNISPMIGNSIHQQRQEMQAPAGSLYSPVMQIPVTPVSLPQPPSAQPVMQTPPASIPVPPLARPERNKRKLLAIVIVLLFILLIGGAIAWVNVFQPFTVPEITKTALTFQNTSLGISLQYPQKWTLDVNKQSGTVKFYDANHTDQVNITVVAAGNQSINQYISKTASSLGMNGQKTQAVLSFAGASWQEVQGSVQQSGANYSAMLLVTLRGERYYSILQLAPSSTYALEDQLVFSKMRSSFQFL